MPNARAQLYMNFTFEFSAQAAVGRIWLKARSQNVRIATLHEVQQGTA